MERVALHVLFDKQWYKHAEYTDPTTLVQAVYVLAQNPDVHDFRVERC